MPLHLPPEPGDTFTVPGRRDRLTIARKIASFRHESMPEKSRYIVETAAGARWLVRENPDDDGPHWIGFAADAEATQP